LGALYWLGRRAGLAGEWLAGPAAAGRLGLIFLTGLTVGGLSCMAVQGGLLASTIASHAAALDAVEADGRPARRSTLLPAAQFLAAKTVAYTALGAALGALGARIPLRLQGWLLLAAALFMLAMALQTLGLHPSLARLIPAAPKRLQRYIRGRSRRGDARGPAVLGALTVFLPCGITLAMEAVAVASGDALDGALVMLAFTLGTVPLFLALGVAIGQLRQAGGRAFRPLAAVLVAAIALFTFNAGARLLGWSLPGGPAAVPGISAPGPAASIPDQQPQELTIQAKEGGYAPAQASLMAGRPIHLKLLASERPACTNAVLFPGLGLEYQLQPGRPTLVELPPQQPGRLAFVCGMGMFGGAIDILP
jgi:sulfite exporter TauE/SafE